LSWISVRDGQHDHPVHIWRERTKKGHINPPAHEESSKKCHEKEPERIDKKRAHEKSPKRIDKKQPMKKSPKRIDKNNP
jgi:hypothetical protein